MKAKPEAKPEAKAKKAKVEAEAEVAAKMTAEEVRRRVVVIGAGGTIGGAVVDALEQDHEVLRASRHGPIRVDMADPASIDALFATVGEVDAVVCCAASGRLTPLTSPSEEDFTLGLEGKLLGQVRLVRAAVRQLRDGGSITLTSGIFQKPTPGGSFGALVNAGLDAFVRAAAIEMPRGIRLNAVSPGWVRETLEKMGENAEEGTPARDVAQVYVDMVTGDAQGLTVVPSPR